MSIIIRLQNLPWEANSLDIRRFFHGLSIPDGGVHIVGGSDGAAFIAFSSDEDARQAMARDGGKVKETPLKLFLSSRNEMQQVIEQARSQSTLAKASSVQQQHQQATPAAPMAPGVQQQMPGLQALGVRQMLPGIGQGAAPGRNGNGFDRPPLDRLHQNGNSPNRRPMTRDRSRSPISRRPPMEQQHFQDGNNMQRFEPNRGPRPHAPPMAGIVSVNQNSNNFGNGQGVRNQFDGFGGGSSGVNNLPGAPQANWNQRPPPLAPATGTSREVPGGIRMPHLNLNAGDRLHFNGREGGGLPHNSVNLGNLRVELRGLPFDVVTRGIQEYLRQVNLYIPEESIKILVDDRGFKTGGAVIRLANEVEFETALSANGRLLGDRRIDVTPLLDSTLSLEPNLPVRGDLGINGLAALPQPPPLQEQLPQRDYVVYMKGIPFNSCTLNDVAGFFRGLRITDIVFEVDARSGKPAGNAYVELGNRDDYEGALELHMKHMGRRYIEVFPTTREDMAEARSKLGPNVQQVILPPQVQQKRTFCILMTGLPQSVTNLDLTAFFQEVNAMPFAIHIMLKPDGINNGEAYIEFLDPEHHRKALERDSSFIASNRINIRNIDYELLASIVRKPAPTPVPMQHPPPHHQGHSGGFGGPRPPHHHGQHQGHHDRSGHGRGDRLPRDRGFDDNRPRRSSPVVRRNNGGGGGGGGAVGGGGGGSAVGGRAPFEDPRSVVIVSNIPYKATNADLDEFFHGFAVLETGIERRVNDRGQTTPEARIAFASTEDANLAVRQMHKKTLLGRPLFLRHAV